MQQCLVNNFWDHHRCWLKSSVLYTLFNAVPSLCQLPVLVEESMHYKNQYIEHNSQNSQGFTPVGSPLGSGLIFYFLWISFTNMCNFVHAYLKTVQHMYFKNILLFYPQEKMFSPGDTPFNFEDGLSPLPP